MDYCDFFASPDGSGVLIALADGMGGYQGGEVASELAVSTAIEIFQQTGFANPMASMEEAFLLANQRILEKQSQDEAYRGMGTTMVLAAMSRTQLIVGHMGDSRATLFRNQFLKRLTLDHLAIVEAEGVLDNGAKSDPRYKGRANILSRYLGGPRVNPDFCTENVEPGDVIFLASDGITEYVLEDRICAVLLKTGNLSLAATQIVDEAIDNGSHDHCSVAIARVM